MSQINISVYESEKVPEGYTENERQHSRMSPTIPQKHVMSSNDRLGLEQVREKTLNRSLSKKATQPAATTFSGPNKISTKAAAEKNLAPAYTEGSETAHYTTSKFQGLSVSKPREHHNSSPTGATTHKASLSVRASRTPPAKMPSQTCPSTPQTSSTPMVTPPPSPPSSAPPGAANNSPTSQIWDKGVSVKEYLMNKLEPGEDEKALSRVISEAMSPRRTPGDVGVIEKVREAVTSLLRTEVPTKHADAKATTKLADTNPTTAARTPSQVSASTSTTSASSQVPVSFNPHEGN